MPLDQYSSSSEEDNSNGQTWKKTPKTKSPSPIYNYNSVWVPQRITRSMSRSKIHEVPDRFPSVSNKDNAINNRPTKKTDKRPRQTSCVPPAAAQSINTAPTMTKNYVNVQLPCYEMYAKKVEFFDKTMKQFAKELKTIDKEITKFSEENL